MFPDCVSLFQQVLYKAKRRESKYAKSGFIWIFTYELKYNENTYNLLQNVTRKGILLTYICAKLMFNNSSRSW